MGVVLVRAVQVDDLEDLVDLQQRGAVMVLADVFPQDRHPFPSDAIRDRWLREIDDPDISTYVATDERGRLLGFAAITEVELLHFGTAVDTWGSGVASEFLDIVVERLRTTTDEPMLRVFEANGRARRFYEKHGWRPTGATSTSTFEPHPVLLEYVLPPDVWSNASESSSGRSLRRW